MGETPKRIVLIDDSEIVLEAMADVLTEAGFEVRAVSSLHRFLNAVMDWKPDVVVTDLYMPGMNGSELCAWLRKQVQTARTPIVLCSSAPEHELAKVAAAVGADAYVSKQSGPLALPERLRELCDEIVW